ILDAWAAGLPVVATALACEGLGVTSGKELLIANTPDEFVNRVRQLVTDDRLWLAVASHARARLQADFSWAALGPRLRAHYAEVAGRAASGTG
ncbi:MAG: glycosyltransferase, partial [Gemmatimonadaceae bacterium]